MAIRAAPILASMLALTLLGPSPALAASPALAGTGDFSRAEQATLARINDYFGQMESMSGDFVQYGPSGEQAAGHFALLRPGRIHFSYHPPAKMDIVADGKSIAIINRKLRTQDVVALEKTPLRHLLAQEVDLIGMASEIAVEDDFVTLVIDDDKGRSNGRITLVFDADSAELRQWIITDAQDLDTAVALFNVSRGVPLDAELFSIDYFLNERTRQRNLN